MSNTSSVKAGGEVPAGYGRSGGRAYVSHTDDRSAGPAHVGQRSQQVHLRAYPALRRPLLHHDAHGAAVEAAKLA